MQINYISNNSRKKTQPIRKKNNHDKMLSSQIQTNINVFELITIL